MTGTTQLGPTPAGEDIADRYTASTADLPAVQPDAHPGLLRHATTHQPTEDAR